MPEIRANGHAIRLPLKRATALLSYLALNRTPVPRSHLASLLWPDTDEPLARTRLRRLIYTIEETVGGGVLLTENDSVAFAIEVVVEVDALRFAHFSRLAITSIAFDEDAVATAVDWATRALRPLLQGIAFGSESFDDWLQAATIDHEHLLARLLERLIDELSTRGDIASALECAETLIGLDVYREPSYVSLMQLHARQGHSAGLEAAYTRCADALRSEFVSGRDLRPRLPTFG